MIAHEPKADLQVSLAVRCEESGDEADIRDVTERAFGAVAEARLVDALRGCERSLSFVAIDDGRIVGHILFTPIATESPTAARIAGLAPLSVHPDYQRKGIGSRLVRAGLDESRRHGYSAIVVVGHPAFYPRFGFVPAHTKGLRCEYPVRPEVFMVAELEADGLKGVSGLVRYRSEFSEV